MIPEKVDAAEAEALTAEKDSDKLVVARHSGLIDVIAEWVGPVINVFAAKRR